MNHIVVIVLEVLFSIAVCSFGIFICYMIYYFRDWFKEEEK